MDVSMNHPSPSLDTVKTNILTKLYEHSLKNEASIVYTRFFNDLT